MVNINNLCTRCGKYKLISPHTECIKCLNKKIKRNKELYKKRLNLGLCPVCSNKRSEQDIIYCTQCRIKQKEKNKHRHSNRKEYRHIIRENNKIEKLCSRCGKRRDDILFLTCGRCRRKQRYYYRNNTRRLYGKNDTRKRKRNDG